MDDHSGPEILLAALGLILLLWGALADMGAGNRACSTFALLSLVVTMIYVTVQHMSLEGPTLILADSFILDGFSFVWNIMVRLAGARTVLLS